jgi:hypothetical protein
VSSFRPQACADRERFGITPGVNGSHSRRIWHSETDALCEALTSAGAWQTAMRVQIADAEARTRAPDGVAFHYRPTLEDAEVLDVELEQLRMHERQRE